MALDEKSLLTAILRQLMKIGEAMGAAPEAAETIRESISEVVREAMVTSEVLRELVSETVSSTIKELVSESVRESVSVVVSEIVTELIPVVSETVEPCEYPQDIKHMDSTAFVADDIKDLWEPSSGLSVQLKRYSISVDAATRVGLLWGNSEFEAYFLASNGSVSVNLVGCNIKGPSGQKLRISSSAAANITAHASGKEVAD